jgi:YHS domain-containing protein
MIRIIVFTVLGMLLARALARFWRGVLEGISGQPQARGGASVPQRGVQMVRDPVCGTFVVPERAITLTAGRQILHFCSAACRDRYRSDQSHTAVEGQTA